jgi:hypothetical protein
VVLVVPVRGREVPDIAKPKLLKLDPREILKMLNLSN